MAQQQDATQSTEKNPTLKDKWTKHYVEMKSRVDDYVNKLKVTGEKHEEFNEAVEKLNKMMADFKDEINKWDNAAKDQKAKYSDALKEDFKELKKQEEKVKRMWEKINTP